MSSTQQLFMVSIPNCGKKPESVFSSLQNIIREKSLCKVHRFDIPALNVGTLDSLMAISDDLIKLNTQVEVTAYNCSLLVMSIYFCIFVLYM